MNVCIDEFLRECVKIQPYIRLVFFVHASIVVMSGGKKQSGAGGDVVCPDGFKLVTDQDVCVTKARNALALRGWSAQCDDFAAIGCFTRNGYTFFNTCEQSSTMSFNSPICEKGTLSFTLSVC